MLRHAVIFAKAATENLGRWMGMDIHKARHEAKTRFVDDGTRVTRLFAPDEADRVSFEREVAAPQIDITLAGRIPSDDPVDIF